MFLSAVQYFHMLHCVVEFYAAMLCCDVFLHVVQSCYMLHNIVEFCAAVLYVEMCPGMLCSVVAWH